MELHIGTELSGLNIRVGLPRALDLGAHRAFALHAAGLHW